jgi:hypothetical protein
MSTAETRQAQLHSIARVPLTGKDNLRRVWWVSLPQLLGERKR